MQLHVTSPSPATNRGELRDAVRMPNPAYCMGRPGARSCKRSAEYLMTIRT